MVPRSRWILAVISVLSLALAADYLFLHVLFPLKQDAYMRELREHQGEPVEPMGTPLETPAPDTTPVPPGASWNPTGTPLRSFASESFQSSLRLCLNLETQAVEATELARELLVLSERTEDLIENWHLRFADGHEERLMVVAADGLESGADQKELRHFGVDSEGLPLPIGKAPVIMDENGQRKLAEVLASGEVFFHQKKQVTEGAGLRADLEWVNGDLRQLHLVTATGSFACAGDSCTCL